MSILMTGVGLISTSMLNSLGLQQIMIMSFIMGFISMFVMIFVTTFFLYSGMARRAGKGTGTAILMTLFPWCMLWIVASKTEQKTSDVNQEKQNDDIAIEL